MQSGDAEVIDERFEIGARVAAGGMGEIYQARDRATGELVALKRLLLESADVAGRFAREARILAELRHPGIVRHVAHGVIEGGARYLAMEWLEGEDLEGRLSRGLLEPAEALALVALVADALAAAHVRGVVHRDIKPSNIFLQESRTDQPRVLDFGVARLVGEGGHLTQAGAIVGTPAYMAPEQIRSAPVDHRADIFALGCVLFECLTGQPPWCGASPVATMAKILFEEPPRLAALRPELPLSLERLIERMLEKDRVRRPSDAAALAAELRAVSLDKSGDERPGPGVPKSLTAVENRLVCVVLAEGAGHGAEVDPYQSTLAESASDAARLLRVAEAHAARLEVLLDGTIVAVLAAAGEATDLSARAARCALALRAELPASRIVLATGRAVMTTALPTGEAIEAAAALFGLPLSPGLGIRIDEATKGLLDLRFHIERDAASPVLVRERAALDDARLLLGRPTPCVGRERELAALEAIFSRCVDEAAATAVLLTGPAGSGKSRVRHELVLRLGKRADVWIARGDPIRQGSPLALLARAIRHAVGIVEGEAEEAGHIKLIDSAKHAGDAGEAERIAEFLGEICGLPFPHEHSLQLEAARQNPILMADQMRRAFEDFLFASASERPVVLVLEDLQWGDLPTVKFVDAALRNARRLPILVFGLARPEVDALFPDLWAERGAVRLELGELSRHACERLVRAVLGAPVPADKVARLVDRAAGNAFYLEELIRSMAEGQSENLPGSVLAMAQARLEALPEELRLPLRAGSVFGETFWLGGVTALVGTDSPAVADKLGMLVEREVLVRHSHCRFPQPGEQEYGFRHSLLREAAYAMLTDHDRALGHRLAAEWLEAAGEGDAFVSAQHFDRGADPVRAAAAYVRAAEQALEANDLEAVLDRAAKAARAGVRGEARAGLRLLEATAYHWLAEYPQGERAAIDALKALTPLSAPWYRAAEEIAETTMPLGKINPLVALGEALHAPPGKGVGLGAFVTAAATVGMQLFLAGKHDAAQAVMQRMETAETRMTERSPLVSARAHFARTARAMLQGDLGAMLDYALAAVNHFDEAGDQRSAALMRTNLAYAYTELGVYDQAEATLRSTTSIAERIGLRGVVAAAKQNLGWVLARQGALEEAQVVEGACIAMCQASSDLRMEGNSRIYMALTLLLAGKPDEAEREARLALSVLKNTPPMRAFALAALAQMLLVTGRANEALEAAGDAMGILESLGAIDEGETLVCLTHARALVATGQKEAAAAAVEVARDKLCARAAKISHQELSDSFLRRVPDNAQLMDLSEELRRGHAASS